MNKFNTLLLIVYFFSSITHAAVEYPRYYLSPSDAIRFVQTTFEINDQLMVTDLSAHESDLLDDRRMEVSTNNYKTRWYFDYLSKELVSYYRIEEMNKYSDLVKKYNEDNIDVSPSEDVKKIAIINTYMLLKKCIPLFNENRGTISFPYPTLIEITELLANNIYNQGYHAKLWFDFRTGTILRMQLSYINNEIKLPLDVKYTRDEANNIAAEYVKNKFSALWAHETFDKNFMVYKENNLALVSDKLGIQHIVYRFYFTYSTTEKIQKWTDYLKFRKYDKYDKNDEYEVLINIPGVVTTFCLDIDAQDGTVRPDNPRFLSDLIQWDYPKIVIDGITTYLIDKPLVNRYGIYINIKYLLETKLWPGKILLEDKEELRIEYGDKIAVIKDDSVKVISDAKELLKDEVGVVTIGRDKYIHYAALSVLTGDTLTWDKEKNILNIQTYEIPENKEGPKLIAPTVPIVLEGENYNQFLEYIVQKLLTKPKTSIYDIACVLISLDKTNNMESEYGKHILQSLINNSEDTKRYVSILNAMLSGDNSQFLQFFDGPPPPAVVLSTLPELFFKYRYSSAGHVLQATCGILSSRYYSWDNKEIETDQTKLVNGLRSLAIISAEDRKQLINFALKRFDKNNFRLNKIASVALAMSKTNQNANEADQQNLSIFLETALLINNQSKTFRLHEANTIYRAGKIQEAIAIAYDCSAVQPLDLMYQLSVVEFLRQINEYASALEFLQLQLISAEEPQTRLIRLAYIDYLSWLEEHGQKAVIINQKSPELSVQQQKLLAADKLFLSGKANDAYLAYRSIYEDNKFSIAMQVDAFSGLLDTNPTFAIFVAQDLTERLSVQPQEVCSRLSAWMGKEICRVSLWSIPQTEYDIRYISFWNNSCVSLNTIENWPVSLSKIMIQLSIINPQVFLYNYAHGEYEKLNEILALLLALAGEPIQAASFLYFNNLNGVSTKVTDPLKSWGYILGKDFSESSAIKLIKTLDNYQQGKKYLTDFEVALVQMQCKKIHEILSDKYIPARFDKNEVIKPRINALSDLLYRFFETIDARQNDDNVNLPKFSDEELKKNITEISNSIAEIMALDPVAFNANIIIRQGLLETMLTVQDPLILECTFETMIKVLDKYQLSLIDKQLFKVEIEFLVTQFNKREDADISLYATKLMDIYLNK